MNITTIHPTRVYVDFAVHLKDWHLTISIAPEGEYGEDYAFRKGIVLNVEEFWFFTNNQLNDIVWVTNNPDHELVAQLNNPNLPNLWKVEMLRAVSDEACRVEDDDTVWEQTGKQVADDKFKAIV